MKDFAGYLEESFNHIPHLFISEEIKQKYLGFASNLPDIFAHSVFGYEKHLADNTPLMDMCVSACNRELYNLCSGFDYPGLNEFTSQNKYWNKLQSFAREWREDSITNLIEIAILEIDAVSLTQEIPVPSVFLGIEALPDLSKESYNEITFNRLKAFLYALGILSGKPVESRVSELLINITKVLADRYQISQAGLMLSRPASPLKICIKRFNRDNLITFLSLILKEEKLKDQLTGILKKYGAIFDSYVLILDIAGSDIIRGGIECYFNNKKQPPGEKRWKEVLNILVADGLCREEFVEPILKFPEKHFLFQISDEVPEYYAQGLHHIKFSAAQEQITIAKVYFWSGFYWKK